MLYINFIILYIALPPLPNKIYNINYKIISHFFQESYFFIFDYIYVQKFDIDI